LAGAAGDSSGAGANGGTAAAGGAGTGANGGTAGSTGGSAGSSTGVNCDLKASDAAGEAEWIASDVACGRLARFDGESGLFMDLGHANEIVAVSRTSDRILSFDVTGHWVLWNVLDRSPIVRGSSRTEFPYDHARPALAGTTLASLATVKDALPALEIRSAVDGTLLSRPSLQLDETTPFGLAADGSYVWVARENDFTVLSPEGDILAQLIGDYADVRVLAKPGEVRLGNGPAANVIETVAIPSGTVTTSAPFLGSFHAWFVDGGRFLTTISTTVRVYSSQTIELDAITVLPRIELHVLTGQYDYFWTYRDIYDLAIYSVFAPDTPVATFPAKNPAPLGAEELSVILTDWRDPAPRAAQLVRIDFTSPSIEPEPWDVPAADVFATDGAGHFAFGGDGTVYDGDAPDRPLSCGYTGLEAAEDGTLVVGTGIGQLKFRLKDGTREYLGLLPFKSEHVELSTNGGILAAKTVPSEYENDRSLRVFSLPGGEELKVWPYSWNDRDSGFLFEDFSMSADGTRFAHTLLHASTYSQTVLDLADNVYMTISPSRDNLQLSADGLRGASNAGRVYGGGELYTVTYLYEGGFLADSVRGTPLGWLDGERILLGESEYPEFEELVSIYNARTRVSTETALPWIYDVVTPEKIISSVGRVCSVPTGEVLWECPDFGAHVSAGEYVVMPDYPPESARPAEYLFFDRY
jgi:hypothetical protein